MSDPIRQPGATGALPLLDPFVPDRPAFQDGAGAITQGELLARAHALAARLPEWGNPANYCESREHFTVALLAIWLRGQTAIFPADRTEHGLQQLRQRFPDLYALGECGADLDLPNPIFVDRVIAEETEGPDGAPAVDGEQLAVRVFTSGSTGTPQMNEKSWAMLVAGGKTIPEMLGLNRLEMPQVVATVPSQHMYGFETTAMYALQGGATIHSGRPMYPADIATALAEVPTPRVLVTTPPHLRALVESSVELPEVAQVISATAPLGAALADAAETRLGAPVHEIYGFTEAGSVAARRTLDGDVWRMRRDFQAESRDGPDGPATVVHWPPFGRDIPFPDVVEALDPQRIRLKGRSQDLINVAGKRASLSGLTNQLLEIDGVVDGVFLQQEVEEEGGRVGRLVAFAVAPGLDRETLRQELRHRLEPAFVPRRIVLLESLPRNATGKLRDADLRDLLHRSAGARD